MPGRVRFEGDFFALDGWMAPPLVRPGGPALWIAGVSLAVSILALLALHDVRTLPAAPRALASSDP
jgi:hypothetical protein